MILGSLRTFELPWIINCTLFPDHGLHHQLGSYVNLSLVGLMFERPCGKCDTNNYFGSNEAFSADVKFPLPRSFQLIISIPFQHLPEYVKTSSGQHIVNILPTCVRHITLYTSKIHLHVLFQFHKWMLAPASNLWFETMKFFSPYSVTLLSCCLRLRNMQALTTRTHGYYFLNATTITITAPTAVVWLTDRRRLFCAMCLRVAAPFYLSLPTPHA